MPAVEIAPPVPTQSARLLRLQLTVLAAFASGSVTAGLMQLGAILLFSLVRRLGHRPPALDQASLRHG